VPATDPLLEARRIMQICNACRYCESYCAVFPAMNRRITFTDGDLNYLANLCHGCGACHYACQYAPPHEFAVHVPKTFAELRVATYRKYAWPAAFARAFEHNGIVVALATAICLTVFVLGILLAHDASTIFGAHESVQAFYRIVPHWAMVWMFGIAGLYVLGVWIIGFVRFWRDTGENLSDFAKPDAFFPGARDALTLRYLDGGGEGCTYPDERPSFSRRLFHHFTFYGFLLCFAATTAGTIFHYGFGWVAPYSLTSLPVVLGTLGGIGLLIGPAGLMWLRSRADPDVIERDKRGLDTGLLVLLFLTSLTGLLLLASRSTPVMGVLLAVHLGVVLALFLVMPYGKFVHGIYRSAALVRYRLERSRPNPTPSFDG
jgi:citrate/tricarballylate utilization protein